MASFRRALFSYRPRRFLLVVVAFSIMLIWFSLVIDDKSISLRPAVSMGQPDHDHLHLREHFPISKDFIMISNVELSSSNLLSSTGTLNEAMRLCNQANVSCLGFINARSHDHRVFSLVMSGATIKRGVNTFYLKASMAGEISFERNFLQCVIPTNNNISQSSGCRLPHLDPWDETIRHLLEPQQQLTCDGTSYTSYSNNVLKFVKTQDTSKIKKITYRAILRPPETDVGNLYGAEETLNLTDEGKKISEDFIEVNTYLHDDETHKEYHAYAAPKPSVLQRKTNHPDEGIPLNIIILGLDGNSNANFQRFLPDAYKFLKDDLKAFIFEGFSSLGEATTPQLTGLLTGRTLQDNCAQHEARRGVSYNPVDNWPFIFKPLVDHGYATMFSEDAPAIGAFSLRLNAFKDQPTDHYGRYFWWAFPADDIGIMDNCINSQPQHVVQLNYLRTFMDAYPKKLKFGFTFLANLCHQSFNFVSSGAQDIYKFLQSFKASSHLNNTMLIVMGDHGARFDEIRSTLQGKLEERLPFLAMVLPETFRQNHPSFTKNLASNTQRIISPLDVHATFMHILKYPNDPSRSSWTKGSSLFSELPSTRQCNDASIPTHFCPCIQFKPISISNTHVYIGALITVQHINKLLTKESTTARMCHKLVLSEIISAVQAMPNKNVQRFNGIEGGIGLGVGKPIYNEEQDIECTYEIQFRTRPNMAIYESTVKFVNGKFAVHGEVSRVNRYGTQSYCITQTFPYLRKFCLCHHH